MLTNSFSNDAVRRKVIGTCLHWSFADKFHFRTLKNILESPSIYEEFQKENGWGLQTSLAVWFPHFNVSSKNIKCMMSIAHEMYRLWVKVFVVLILVSIWLLVHADHYPISCVPTGSKWLWLWSWCPCIHADCYFIPGVPIGSKWLCLCLASLLIGTPFLVCWQQVSSCVCGVGVLAFMLTTILFIVCWQEVSGCVYDVGVLASMLTVFLFLVC